MTLFPLDGSLAVDGPLLARIQAALTVESGDGAYPIRTLAATQNAYTSWHPRTGMDYDASLDRAMDAVPDFTAETDRLTVPDAVAQPDGAFTRLTNLAEVADALSREPRHLHRFIQRELGTNGKFADGRARYNGSFTGSDFDAAVSAYMEEYVLCSECGLPDTRLVREDRTPMLRCDACGAFRPVAKRRSTASTVQNREAVEEGNTYEVKITGTGRKGDGVAERGKYTIFVPGAQEGQVVDIYIENVSGNLAFARISHSG